MTPLRKNKLTISILGKLKKQGVPESIPFDMAMEKGEEEVEGLDGPLERQNPEEIPKEDLNSLSFENPLEQRPSRKKKRL